LAQVMFCPLPCWGISGSAMEATLAKVRPLMKDVKVPNSYDKVFKDECAFTFDTPFSENGLCVNLKSWLGVSTDLVALDLKRSGSQGGLYLQQRFRRVPKEKPADEPAAVEPTKLAIGVAGGFLLDDKWDVKKEYSLLIEDGSGDRTTVPLPDEELPTIVTQACEAIIAHMGAKSMEETNRWEADSDLKESKYAKDLVQLPAFKISPNPADWRCQKYDATENLWLNLSDGYIGGGRKFFDGSGGSGGALEHFEEEQAKGNFYPMCVKLGTITPQGADVYCYAKEENDMVKDPLLAEHLAHWGIDIMKMEKTAKSLAEMEVDLNSNYDFSRICESGGNKPLVPLRGPGLVGLKNLGNSCYMNSSVQLLMGLPESKARYVDADLTIRTKAPTEVNSDLVSQVAKLSNGMMSDRYAPPLKEGEEEDDPKLIVAPQAFRTLIGKGHPEFSSNRQQDAGEFLSYFLEQLARAERTALGSKLEAGKPLANLFEFAVESRLEQCTEAKGVLYSRQKQNMLMLSIKLEDADNLAEVTAFREKNGIPQNAEEKDPKKPKTEGDPEEPKPVIQLKSALDRWAAAEDGIEFRGAKATKSTRLATMPQYMMLQVGRYSINEKWMPVKFDCQVPMPESVSLEHLRSKGLQPGESELKDEGPASATTAPAVAGPEPDELIIAQLLSMGVPDNAAKRACLAVSNAGADMAASWYFEHMGDANINDPLEAPAGGGGGGDAGGPTADPALVIELSSFGFAEKHVVAALKACNNSSERAADWLFSHADDLDGAVAALGSSDAGAGGGGGAEEYDDGVGEYSLVGFISHIGRHPSHGHYVCHARRGPGGDWVIFDDQKVALSESPPLDLGYIYLYRRKDAA